MKLAQFRIDADLHPPTAVVFETMSAGVRLTFGLSEATLWLSVAETADLLTLIERKFEEHPYQIGDDYRHVILDQLGNVHVFIHATSNALLDLQGELRSALYETEQALYEEALDEVGSA